MFPLWSLCAVCFLVIGASFCSAQSVVNSTYTGACEGHYSDPDCWSPREVPLNSASRSYNVTFPASASIFIDVSGAVSNLNLTGYAYLFDGNFSVEGTTVVPVDGFYHVLLQADGKGPSLFNAGTLSTFSANTLRGSYAIDSLGSAATLQFNGADIRTLSEGTLFLGLLSQIVDESGNDGLRNLARIDPSGELRLESRDLITLNPFTNDGTLSLGPFGGAAIFTAGGSLTNFDSNSRTIQGGKFVIGSEFSASDGPRELRFAGADIVNNGSDLTLGGVASRIADLLGNDGLRNLAHNLAGGALRFIFHDRATLGSFQNDGLVLLRHSTFSIAGSLTNFDAASRTLNGGNYTLADDAVLRFANADIVRNGAGLALSGTSRVTDLTGADGLRNFSENLASGSFRVGSAQEFHAPGDFTNAGRIETARVYIAVPELPPQNPGLFAVAAGSTYTQTGGSTVNEGAFTADTIHIFGGVLTGAGSIHGNVTISNATAAPLERSTLNGDLTFASGSHFHVAIKVRNFVDTWHTITGKVTLGGNLDVVLADQVFLGSDSIVTLLQSGGPITGTFSNAPAGARVATADGKGSFVVLYEANAVKLTQFHTDPPPARLLNISSRALLAPAGDDVFHDRTVLIGGFMVTGSETKKVVLRAIGPSLAPFNVSSPLPDPVLELHDAAGALLATNDDWKQGQASEITQLQLAPTVDRESAIVADLAPGSYTAVLKEKNGAPGNAVVEVYDVSGSDLSKLANISTRGWTDSSNLLIGGVIIGGAQANDELIVRALGPQLRRAGLFNAIEDPTLELRDVNGALIDFNDDWAVNFEETYPIYELVPVFSVESAMRVSLPGGNYTAIVRPKGNGAGVALVEFYDLRR